MNARRAVVVTAIALILAGCSADAEPGASAETTPASTPSPSQSPSVTRTPRPTPTPKPSPTPPAAASFKYACGEGKSQGFSTMEAVWASSMPLDCDAVPQSGVADEAQKAALQIAYGSDFEETSLQYLYGICASTAGYPFESPMGLSDWSLSDGQALEVQGALSICPSHPRAGELAALTEAAAASAAQARADEEAEAVGKFIREDGSYFIDSDIVAGTWQSTRDRVENCYWEISDAQGNIIDNNFISVAPQLTLPVPASAAGFTTQGCGSWRWIG